MESILFLIAGISSFVVSFLLGKRKWDGMLQWILVTQNMFIGGIMIIRAFEHWNMISSSIITNISSFFFATIQLILMFYLFNHIDFKSSKGEKWATGNNGIQRIQGIQGTVGSTGLQGEQGIQGDKGDTGIQGIHG